MSNTLIVMRHGKAERPEEGVDDKDRQLSAYGARALRATCKQSLKQMRKNATVNIWSSPALRAMQTAEIVFDACKQAGIQVIGELESVDALWDCDFDAFIEHVRSCSADVVFAVGHNPFIEDVVEQLTGSRITFATGSFAAISLSANQAQSADTAANSGQDAHDNTPVNEQATENDSIEANEEYTDEDDALLDPPGRLLWFIQGPIAQRWKTVLSIEETLASAANTIDKRLDAFLADPDDIETMHKFRVSIRTMRSLLAFASRWLDKEQCRACQINLRDIVRETSRLRELDVLSVQAAEDSNLPAELTEFCAEQAKKERGRVIKVLRSKRIKKLLADTIDQIKHLDWRKRIEMEGLDTAEMRSYFDGLVAKIEDELTNLNIADVEATHDVRKNAKRMRYDAEQFKKLLGDDAVAIAKGMTSHQDNLGAICDARVNIDIIGGFESMKLPEQVAWGLALLRAKNETYLYTTLFEG